ncbi:MAG: sporulation protein YqfD [Clostridia bacterium]
MIFKILFYYIVGYLNIIVEGVFVERFINICKSKNILLWNIKMEKGVKLYANIGIKDYRNIREIARKTNTKIRIRKKCGIPFLLNKYKKRKILVGIVIVIALGLIVTSNFIWNINITGNTQISTEEIVKALEEEGLKLGTYKGNLDTTNIIQNIRLKRDDIAWMGITIKGTNAEIQIKETTKAPSIVDKDEYCNIIADKEGMITKISVQNGTANVKVGDIVKKGDILAYGYLEGKYTGIRYVHSMADIEAKVWYSKKEKVYLNQEVPTDTGNTETKYSLVINNFKINFYKTLSKFEKYDTINESKKLMLFSNFYLPIELIKTTNEEYVLKDVTYTAEELTRNYSTKNRRRTKNTNTR